MKIPNILTFNEPDLSAHGGSNVNPAYGAQVWVNNITPPRRMCIRAGLPVPTGSSYGLSWLGQFLGNCSRIIGQHCAYDFVTLHLYDPFEGLASQMGEYVAT